MLNKGKIVAVFLVLMLIPCTPFILPTEAADRSLTQRVRAYYDALMKQDTQTIWGLLSRRMKESHSMAEVEDYFSFFFGYTAVLGYGAPEIISKKGPASIVRTPVTARMSDPPKIEAKTFYKTQKEPTVVVQTPTKIETRTFHETHWERSSEDGQWYFDGVPSIFNSLRVTLLVQSLNDWIDFPDMPSPPINVRPTKIALWPDGTLAYIVDSKRPWLFPIYAMTGGRVVSNQEKYPQHWKIEVTTVPSGLAAISGTATYRTIYERLAVSLVRKGQEVKRHELIGYAKTGHLTALTISYFKPGGDKPVDPRPFLKKENYVVDLR